MEVRSSAHHMPRKSPFIITLTAREKEELKHRSAKYTSPYIQVVRAKMILLAAEGFSNDQIAQRLDTPRQIVSRWRKRFFAERLAGLEEMLRPGRPRSFPPRAGRAD
jgi:DNA-binding CsgD family transcriptional regulator